MKLYRGISLALGCTFAIVGVVFLVFPDGVLRLFNFLSPRFSLAPSALVGHSFYLVLAASYMYMVTILAFGMYRHPENRYFPLLLINAKAASSLLSLTLFVVNSRLLIFAANFVVDGLIALLVLVLCAVMKRNKVWASS